MTHSSDADIHFAQHPTCPNCGAQRTQRAQFGMPAYDDYRDAPPWVDWRGCCVTEDIWTCSVCKHTWR